MSPDPAARLRRAEALLVQHEGKLNPQGEMLLKRTIFAAKYALREERERGA